MRSFSAVVAALALSACADSAPSNHAGFMVQMSQSEAFDLACEKMSNGALSLGPVLYTEGNRRPSHRRESICDLREEALAADRWWLIEPGFRDKYIVFDFEDGRLQALQLKWIGWEP